MVQFVFLRPFRLLLLASNLGGRGLLVQVEIRGNSIKSDLSPRTYRYLYIITDAPNQDRCCMILFWQNILQRCSCIFFWKSSNCGIRNADLSHLCYFTTLEWMKFFQKTLQLQCSFETTKIIIHIPHTSYHYRRNLCYCWCVVHEGLWLSLRQPVRKYSTHSCPV